MRDPKKTIELFVTYQNGGHIKKDSLLESLVLFYKWILTEQCVIRDIYAEHIILIPNRTQLIVLATMMQQAFEGKPVRVIILKARKVGVSTFIQALFYFLCALHSNRLAKTIAHEIGATQEIFDIARLMAESCEDIESHIGQKGIAFVNRSNYFCRTAGGHGVGAGGTPNYVHLSEMALWQLKKEQTDYTLTSSVPDVNPDTIIVYESTAKGRELFWFKFENASDPQSVYEAIFIPWYFDEKCQVPVRNREGFEITEEENELIDRAREEGVYLGLEALQWRRDKIVILGPEIFRQEYPSTPEEAVQASKGLILPGIRACLIDTLPFNIDTMLPHQMVGGIDYGYYDPTVVISAIYLDQVVYLIDIYNRAEGLASDHALHLKENHTYYMDPSAVMGREELRKEVKFPCRIIASPRVKQPGGIVKSELQAVRDLIRHGKLKILRSCSDQLLKESDNYAWNPRTGEPDDKRTVESGHYDTIDALRYLVAGVMDKKRTEKKVTARRPAGLSRVASLKAV